MSLFWGGALAFFGGPGRQQRSKNKANTTKQIGEHPICFLFAFFKHHFYAYWAPQKSKRHPEQRQQGKHINKQNRHKIETHICFLSPISPSRSAAFSRPISHHSKSRKVKSTLTTQFFFQECRAPGRQSKVEHCLKERRLILTPSGSLN